MNTRKNKQIFNPYLPSYEYIPDGEPHIFGDRLYIYGSHDRFGGSDYCENDYVCWSAPVDDLSDWHFEGEIYNRKQHPYREERMLLFAPDVVKGADGRFYLYYSMAHSSRMSVAVSASVRHESSLARSHVIIMHLVGSESASSFKALRFLATRIRL